MGSAPIDPLDYELALNSFVEVSSLHEARSVGDVTNAIAGLLSSVIGVQDFTIFVRHPIQQVMHVALQFGTVQQTPQSIAAFTHATQNFYGDPIAVVPLCDADKRTLGLAVASRMLPHKEHLTARDHALLAILSKHGGLALGDALARDMARDLAASAPETSTGGLVVRAGSTLLALNLECVAEVYQMVALCSRPPNLPPYCMGLIEYRGKLIPLYDLAASLTRSNPRTDVDLVHGYLVIPIDDAGFAWAVDELEGMFEAGEREQVDLPPVLRAAGLGRGVQWDQGEVVPMVQHMRRFMEQSLTGEMAKLVGALESAPA